MYVLADLEWANTKEGQPYPTQLALMRVDDAWGVTDRLFSRVRPLEDAPDWRHCAFSGGQARDFQGADGRCGVEARLRAWLRPDDVLCWWFDQAKGMFQRFFPALSGHGAMILSEYMPEYLRSSGVFHRNPYKLAKELLMKNGPARGEQTELPSPEHQSSNDAEVMRTVLLAAGFPSSRLTSPPRPVPGREAARERPVRPEAPVSAKPAPYLYDPSSKRLHARGCGLADPTASWEEFDSLKKPVQRGYTPCKCCASPFYRALAERNRDILARCPYTYVYAPGSGVFHRYTCKALLLARGILGTGKYRSCVESGRRPCKRCRPSPSDAPKISPKGKAVKQQEISKEAQRALCRFHQARRERSSRKGAWEMGPEEKRDFLTLTHPGYVFWAAKGYRNFHRRSCPKLKGCTSLTGFSRFADAVRAGYTPCRLCKPTKKLDAAYSIPIGSRTRAGESYKDLEELCGKYGYPCSLDKAGTFFSLETPVGKWRIDLSTKPVSLEHINLVAPWGSRTRYHRQPRLFLSLSDALAYIRRHDTVLQQKQKDSQADGEPES